MKNKKRSNILAILAVIFFWLGWLILRYVIATEELIYAWTVFFCFFIGMVFLAVASIVENEKKTIIVFYGICIFGSIVLGFGHWLSMVGIIALCLLLLRLGISRIKDEQRNRIKVDVYMTLRRGIPVVGLVVSILIASGFYFFLMERQKISKVPTIDVKIPQQLTNRAIHILSFFEPGENLKLIVQGATVDEYLERSIMLEKTETMQDPRSQVLAQENLKLMIEEGRNLLSQQFGRELSGDERMTEVINEMLEKRMYDIVNGQITDAPLMPFGAAAALFVVLYSLSWFLGILVIWTSVGIFYILMKLQIVKIRKESQEIEIIE